MHRFDIETAFIVFGVAISAFPASAISQTAVRGDSACRALVNAAATRPIDAMRSRKLAMCGAEGVSAYRQMLTQSRGRADSAFHNALRETQMPSDATILASGENLALDRGATVPARLTALQVMFAQTFGPDASYGSPKGGAIESLKIAGECVAVSHGERPRLPDAVTRLRTTTESIMEEGNNPEAVRAAAACIRENLHPRYVPRIDVTKITAEHACDTQIRVRNGTDSAVVLQYRVDGARDMNNIEIEARGTARFSVGTYGVARLFYRGQQVAQVRTVRGPCPTAGSKK